MSPNRAAAAVDLGRFRQLQLADLFELLATRFDQQQRRILIVVAVQPAVGVGDRAAAIGSHPLFPQRLAGLQILRHPHPTAALARAIDHAVDQHHAAMVVLHRLGAEVVQRFGLQRAIISSGQSQQHIAGAVVTGVIEQVLPHDRRGDHGDIVAGRTVLEQQFAVFGVEGGQARLAGRDIERDVPDGVAQR